MGFLRFAKANLTAPLPGEKAWEKVRVASTGEPLPVNLIEQASEILKENFDPRNYLLTHCTIVASVGTEAPPNVEIGRVKFGSQFVNRKYPNFYIKPESEGKINNNQDSWSHPVLMKSYRTFVGAHNWVEHVQLEELSKGRVIDAVPREVEDGNSIYVDILVATHRKHDDLIRQIQDGELSTLSMGCFLPGTQITMADGTRLPIEEVQPGDMVLTHKGRLREVENIQLRRGTWDLCQIYVEGISEGISATDNHPFFVRHSETEIVEVPAEELRMGNTLYLPGPSGIVQIYPVRFVERGKHEGWVHNFEVEEDHSYIAGGVAVHNCSVDETQCTKCGHVAADETQMCAHVKYEKGNHFYDPSGIRRKVAELCGNEVLEPTAGVHFIDASWVRVPAFTGAVLRNIIGPGEISPEMARMAGEILASPPAQWTSSGIDAFMKAASVAAAYRRAQFPEEDEDPDAEEGKEKKDDGSPLDSLTDQVYNFVTERVRRKIEKDLKGDKKPEESSDKGSMDSNESVIKESSRFQMKASDTYKVGLAALVKTARCKEDFIRGIATFNEVFKIRVPKRLYVASLKVGSTSRYGSLDQFLCACHRVLGRKVSMGEAKTLIRLGQLLNNLENKP